MGGSSGGGGGAGQIGYPAYVSATHEAWIGDGTAVAAVVAQGIDTVMAAALTAGSPLTGLETYDPDNDITSYESAMATFAAILAGISDTGDWASLYNQAMTSLSTPTAVTIADRVVADGDVVGDLTVVDGAVVDAVAVGDLAIVDEVVADITDTTDVTGITEAIIVADGVAFAAQLDDQITTTVLPRFRRGMQDINAVISSAFPIGESIIESFRNREVAKHDSGIRLNAVNKNADIGLANESLHLEVKKVNIDKDVRISGINLSKDTVVGTANLSKDVEISKINMGKNLDLGKANLLKDVEVGKLNVTKDLGLSNADLSKELDIGKANLNKDVAVGTFNVKSTADYKRMYIDSSAQMVQIMLQRISWEDGFVRTNIEAKRIKIVAKKEQIDGDNSLAEAEALWDLEVFQYGSNLLAGPGGGTLNPGAKKPNVAASVIGGAMSGAAAGAMVGAQMGSAVPGYGTAIGAVLGAAAGLMGSM